MSLARGKASPHDSPRRLVAWGRPRLWQGEIRRVGFTQTKAALRVILPPPTKFVLVTLAIHACQDCGLARPGVALLSAETGLSERAVREALRRLRAELTEHGQPEWLKVSRYGRGGRGVTTEFIVFPALAKFSTEECGRCESTGKRVHPAQGK